MRWGPAKDNRRQMANVGEDFSPPEQVGGLIPPEQANAS